jgi:excisionase family DNA binding protein
MPTLISENVAREQLMPEPTVGQEAFDWSPDRCPDATPGTLPPPSEPSPIATKPRRASAAPRFDAEERRLRWLTADEATTYLGFPSRKALYAAVERGQVPAHRLGRRLRFRRAELDGLLARTR